MGGARAASGHAAAPPTSVMNSRRFIYARGNFSQQRYPFASDHIFESDKARRIAAGLGETRYKTSGNRVEDLHEDDRYRPGLLQQRRQNRRAGGKNDVRRERDQFGSIFADPHRVARGPTDVDLQVATLAPTELLKSLAKCCQSAQRLLVIVSPRQQHTDPPHALGLLRPHSERPRRRPAEKRDELATPHSITSSARASTAGGISRPSTLAVLRLITSSYLVGACTGRSAGFSPLRMRST